jgi:hypothetical protein
MISAAAALASGLLLTAIACGANVARAPAGRCHPAGKRAGTRDGIAGPLAGLPALATALEDDDVAEREQAAVALNVAANVATSGSSSERDRMGVVMTESRVT